MDGETRKAIKNEIAILKKKEYSDRYAFEIEGLKQSLVDRLPSLRKQLEEQEEIRKTNAIEAARLEEERKRKEAEERQRPNWNASARKRKREPRRRQRKPPRKYRQPSISVPPVCLLPLPRRRSRKRSKSPIHKDSCRYTRCGSCVRVST